MEDVIDAHQEWKRTGEMLPESRVSPAMRHPKMQKLVLDKVYEFLREQKISAWDARGTTPEFDAAKFEATMSLGQALRTYQPRPDLPRGGRSFEGYFRMVVLADLRNWHRDWRRQQQRAADTVEAVPYGRREVAYRKRIGPGEWDFLEETFTPEKNGIPGWSIGLVADDEADERAAEEDRKTSNKWEPDTEARWGQRGAAVHEPWSKASSLRFKSRVAKDQSAKVPVFSRDGEWAPASNFFAAVDYRRSRGVDPAIDKMMQTKEEQDSDGTDARLA